MIQGEEETTKDEEAYLDQVKFVLFIPTLNKNFPQKTSSDIVDILCQNKDILKVNITNILKLIEIWFAIGVTGGWSLSIWESSREDKDIQAGLPTRSVGPTQ